MVDRYATLGDLERLAPPVLYAPPPGSLTRLTDPLCVYIRQMERASRTLEVKRGASEYQNEGGSWVRYDGIIVVPANYEDFKTWAVSPEMSGDYQIILLVLASILSAFGYEEYGIDRRLSGGVFTFLKVLGIAWASLYWCQACSDFVLAL